MCGLHADLSVRPHTNTFPQLVPSCTLTPAHIINYILHAPSLPYTPLATPSLPPHAHTHAHSCPLLHSPSTSSPVFTRPLLLQQPDGGGSAATASTGSGAAAADDLKASVYIANLNWWTSDQEVEAACLTYGRVTDLKFMEDRGTG